MLQRWRQATTLPCSTVLLLAGQPCQATTGKGIRVGLGVVRRCRQLTNALPQDIEYTSASGSGAVAAARPLRPPSRTRAGTTVQQPAYAAAAAVTSLAAVGFATYHLLSTVELPPLDIAAAAAGRACSCVGAVVASGLLLAKLILGDRFHVQLHRYVPVDARNALDCSAYHSAGMLHLCVCIILCTLLRSCLLVTSLHASSFTCIACLWHAGVVCTCKPVCLVRVQL
jgi:hypothetical protein